RHALGGLAHGGRIAAEGLRERERRTEVPGVDVVLVLEVVDARRLLRARELPHLRRKLLAVPEPRLGLLVGLLGKAADPRAELVEGAIGALLVDADGKLRVRRGAEQEPDVVLHRLRR